MHITCQPTRVEISTSNKAYVAEVNPSAPDEYWPKNCPVTRQAVLHAIVNGRSFTEGTPYVYVVVKQVRVAYDQEAWGDRNWAIEAPSDDDIKAGQAAGPVL